MAFDSRTRYNEIDDKLIDRAGGYWQTDRVSAGTALTLSNNLHAGKTILLDTATGSTVTLPTATGSNIEYEIATSVIATSNSHIVKVPDATTYFTGALTVVDNADGSSTTFGTTGATTTRSDTITLNRTTTGSVAIGERLFVKDIAAGYWAVRGVVVGTGVEATPFSAAV
jgi:hypothetical protein